MFISFKICAFLSAYSSLPNHTVQRTTAPVSQGSRQLGSPECPQSAFTLRILTSAAQVSLRPVLLRLSLQWGRGPPPRACASSTAASVTAALGTRTPAVSPLNSDSWGSVQGERVTLGAERGCPPCGGWGGEIIAFLRTPGPPPAGLTSTDSCSL